MTEVKQTVTAKVSAPKTKPNHPPAIDMVKSAILTAKSRKGLSLNLIKRYLIDTHNIDIEKYGPFLRRAIVAGVEKGILVRMGNSKGSSGSFKLAPVEKVAKKETVDEAKPKVVKKAVEKKETKVMNTTKETIKKVDTKKVTDKKVSSKKVVEKTVKSSDKVEKPVKSSDKVEKPVKSSDKVEKPVKSSDKVEKPVKSSDKVEKPVKSSDKVEKPVKPAAKTSPVKAKKPVVTKAKVNKVVKTVTKPSPKKVVPKKTAKKVLEKK